MYRLHVPLYINGERVEGLEGTADALDPATGEKIGTFAVAGTRQVDDAVAAARQALTSPAWAGIRPFERGRILARIADRLMQRRDEIARLLVHDSGKPLRDAYWEVDCSARFFEFYAGICDKLHGNAIPLGKGWMDWTIREPIGVSAQILPWNYPLQVGVRGIAPALAAGCTVVVKPSMETGLSLWPLVEACEEAGLPPGVLNVVNGRGSQVGEYLARHPGIDQITFTGSVSTGIRVAQAAGSRPIPTLMELGGKSPQILFADADMESALNIIANGMYCHAGQVCNAGTRLLVEESVHDQVVEKLHRKISDFRLGHGLDDPDMGPVISRDQKETVEEYMGVAEEEGGTLLLGAEVPSEPALRNGFFVRPAIVTGLTNESRVAREEIFGPVLTVLPFRTMEQAIEMANDSEFGLVAGVFTSDVSRAMYACQELKAGQIWVNSFGVGLDVEFPFGGYKRSGYGREKGLEGLAAYTQIKNVCIKF